MVRREIALFTFGNTRIIMEDIYMADISKTYSILIPGVGCEIREPYDLYSLRQDIIKAGCFDDTEVTILIPAHNRPTKLRACIESILEYTDDVSYRILVADASDDVETRSYLASLVSDKIRLLRIEGTQSSAYKLIASCSFIHTPYLAIVAADVVVTKDWLSNLLRCVKSSPDIGWACPMSTNVSNKQQVDFSIHNHEDLLAHAETFNRSDPRKWEERLRLINIVTLCPTELICVAGFGDPGFRHDFGEDDMARRIRAAGYRLMLCGDVFVHHDHDFRNLEDKNAETYEKGLRIGREQYKQKHHGLDAWDDVLNFEPELLSLFRPASSSAAIPPKLLGVDCRMGTPLLELKNAYRKADVFNCACYAFTTEAKYFFDLQTICDAHTACDRSEYICEHFSASFFDAILLGEPLNAYTDPLLLLSRLFSLLKPGGQLLFKLKNTQSALSLCQIIGTEANPTDEIAFVDLSIDAVSSAVGQLGAKDLCLSKSKYNADDAFQTNMRNLLNVFLKNNSDKVKEQFERMMTSAYCICVTK